MGPDLHGNFIGITAERVDIFLNPSKGLTLLREGVSVGGNIQLLALTIVQTGIGHTRILSFLARQKAEG